MKTDLRLPDVETASVYLKLSVAQKMRHLKTFPNRIDKFNFKTFSKVSKANFHYLEKRIRI